MSDERSKKWTILWEEGLNWLKMLWQLGGRHTEVGRARSDLNLATHTEVSKFEVSRGALFFRYPIILDWNWLSMDKGHLERCTSNSFKWFLSRKCVFAKLRTFPQNFELRTSVCLARLRCERARPTSVCLPPLILCLIFDHDSLNFFSIFRYWFYFNVWFHSNVRWPSGCKPESYWKFFFLTFIPLILRS